MKRAVVYALMGALYLLHNDLWAWDDPRPVLGLPVGLTYHVLFCFAVAGVMWLALRWAWPADVEPEVEPAAGEAGRGAPP
jgi:hypothetical protein